MTKHLVLSLGPLLYKLNSWHIVVLIKSDINKHIENVNTILNNINNIHKNICTAYHVIF